MTRYGGTGFAAGYSVGLATGLVMADQERSRGRRLRVKGRDQLLLKVKGSVDKVGKAIAKTFSNWYYKDGSIYRKRDYPFDFLASFVFFSVTAIILTFAWILWCPDTFLECTYPINLRSGTLISAIFGLIGGFLFGYRDEEVDFIRLSKLKKDTLVLIKIYDNDGFRNLDDDEITLILENLKTLR